MRHGFRGRVPRSIASPLAGVAPLAAAMLLAAALQAIAVSPARAQNVEHTLPIAPDRPDSIVRITIQALGAHPLDLESLRGRMPMARSPISKTPPPPLDPALSARLRRATFLRDQGQFASARDSLRALLSAVPHHALVLTELGRTLIALDDNAGVERLARPERMAQKDSLLLAQELAAALERLGRPTDAALIAIEAWASTPAAGDWAGATLARLTPADVHKTRDAMRRAVAASPERGDLARALARLEWRAGDTQAMVRALAAADRTGSHGTARWTFAEELLHGQVSKDSTAAFESLIDLAADHGAPPQLRTAAANRAWEVAVAHGDPGPGASRIAKALADVPAAQWENGFALELARALRQSGRTNEARALLDSGSARSAPSDLALERALADLRDGPPSRALPALKNAAGGSEEGMYRYAEALFFDGQCDSARNWYQRLADNSHGERTGAALERLFLIEDADPKEALPAFARACYASWRGDGREAAAIAESLYLALPRGALWAQTALLLSAERDAAGDAKLALVPLLALADSLPEDRLAPLARQRAGDLYRDRLKDDAQAVKQYEACLIAYPRAWNAPEVRRSLERLRKERRL
jgi:tetratricopeptide (TPR) repeat protein